MRKEASLELWRELYDLAVEIKKLEPWNYLWDMDLIEIQLPGYQEPVYCSVMGKGGQCYGIGLYEGSKGLADFNMIATADEFMLPTAYVMGEQSNLSCYFGDREEVPREQKAVIKELGLKFRGRGQWIYFESYKKRYLPTNGKQRCCWIHTRFFLLQLKRLGIIRLKSIGIMMRFYPAGLTKIKKYGICPLFPTRTAPGNIHAFN